MYSYCYCYCHQVPLYATFFSKKWHPYFCLFVYNYNSRPPQNTTQLTQNASTVASLWIRCGFAPGSENNERTYTTQKSPIPLANKPHSPLTMIRVSFLFVLSTEEDFLVLFAKLFVHQCCNNRAPTHDAYLLRPSTVLQDAAFAFLWLDYWQLHRQSQYSLLLRKTISHLDRGLQMFSLQETSAHCQ